jgi:Flp pilus assembly protein TadB
LLSVQVFAHNELCVVLVVVVVVVVVIVVVIIIIIIIMLMYWLEIIFKDYHELKGGSDFSFQFETAMKIIDQKIS